MFSVSAKAFMVEDGHFLIVIPDQLTHKTIDDKGFTKYTNSFENQTLMYMKFDSNKQPRQVLETLNARYMQKQSNPTRGRICGEDDGAFYVILYNPQKPTEMCVIMFVYDDNLPYNNMLRKFNEDVSCSHYSE